MHDNTKFWKEIDHKMLKSYLVKLSMDSEKETHKIVVKWQPTCKLLYVNTITLEIEECTMRSQIEHNVIR